MYFDVFTIIIWTLHGTLSPQCYFSHTSLVFSHYSSILPLRTLRIFATYRSFLLVWLMAINYIWH